MYLSIAQVFRYWGYSYVITAIIKDNKYLLVSGT